MFCFTVGLRLILQDFSKPDDSSQRRAQFVAHVGKKHAFTPTGGLSQVASTFELAVFILERDARLAFLFEHLSSQPLGLTPFPRVTNSKEQGTAEEPHKYSADGELDPRVFNPGQRDVQMSDRRIRIVEITIYILDGDSVITRLIENPLKLSCPRTLLPLRVGQRGRSQDAGSDLASITSCLRSRPKICHIVFERDALTGLDRQMILTLFKVLSGGDFDSW